MSTILGKMHVQEFVLDIAAGDAGTGTIDLSVKAGANPLPIGAMVKSVEAKILTAFAAGTDLAWGNQTDSNGFSGTAIVTASLTANAVFNGEEDEAAPGALIKATIGTTPAAVKPIPYRVPDTNGGAFSVVMTGTHTAGKAVFIVEFYMPKL